MSKRNRNHGPVLRTFCVVIALAIAGIHLCAAQEAAPQATSPQPAPSSPAPSPAAPAITAPLKPPPSDAPPQPDRRQARAKTSEEATAYPKLLAEKNPNERVRQAEDFLLQYPDSELKEYVFQVAMQAYQAKNDYNHLLTYGELTLAQNPDNLNALLVLSSSISEMTGREDADRNDKLEDGEQYSAHALELLEKLPHPPGAPEEAWNQLRKESQSRAHAARGLIGLIREDFARAEQELKAAVDLTLQPDAVLLYRLALSYSFQKKYDQALEPLDRAAALGGVRITNPGGKPRDLVAEAKEFAMKALAPAAPTSAAAAPPAPVADHSTAPAAGKSPQPSSVP